MKSMWLLSLFSLLFLKAFADEPAQNDVVKLTGGNSLLHARAHSVDNGAMDTTTNSEPFDDGVVYEFWKHVGEGIRTGNSSMISSRIEDFFVFEGCQYIYFKERFVSILMDYKNGWNDHNVVKLSTRHYFPKYIKQDLHFTPISQSINYSLFFYKENGTLVAGYSSECTEHFAPYEEKPSIESFWVELKAGVKSKNLTQISKLLDPHFQFHTCLFDMNKDTTLMLIKKSPEGILIGIGSELDKVRGSNEKRRIQITGFGESERYIYTYHNTKTNVLVAAIESTCVPSTWLIQFWDSY